MSCSPYRNFINRLWSEYCQCETINLGHVLYLESVISLSFFNEHGIRRTCPENALMKMKIEMKIEMKIGEKFMKKEIMDKIIHIKINPDWMVRTLSRFIFRPLNCKEFDIECQSIHRYFGVDLTSVITPLTRTFHWVNQYRPENRNPFFSFWKILFSWLGTSY